MDKLGKESLVKNNFEKDKKQCIIFVVWMH